MTVWAIILAFQERDIIPFTLRHYTSFCDRVTVYDAGSTDGTREICAEYGAEVVDWKTDGVNDILAKKVKETAWHGTDFDWVMPCDADELFYFPQGGLNTLQAYDAAGVAVVKPHGFEMVSDVFPTTDRQLYDEVKFGGRDDKWYAKSFFSPKRVKTVTYSAGAHSIEGVLSDGRRFGNPTAPNDPPTYMLHCKHLGPVERIAKKYDVQRTRLSPTNVKGRFGNFEKGSKHARDKRAAIMKTYQQVIP